MKHTPKLFTPNKERGGDERYRLYRRGENLFSTTPDGETFRAKVERDSCGLGCFCGAFVTPTSLRGKKILDQAETYEC